MKRFLISFILALVLIGALGLYGVSKYKNSHRETKSNTKAPQISITLLEGWNINDIAQYLEKNNITTTKNFTNEVGKFDASNYSLLDSKPKNSSLEGFIFPDTYFIPKNPATSTNINEIILKKALDNFDLKITPEMVQKSTTNDLSLYQTITLASIVEKESNKNETDRKTIAGIFYNRLKAGIPLQSDATVNYVTKKNLASPDITDTLVDSPYNTYKYKGLPPGPICNPSLGSIMAVLEPEKTDYLYFLTDPKTGRAIFSKTFDEHIVNKFKYLK